MRRVVFIGAGASKPLGYPLTSEILPAIHEKLKSPTHLFGNSASDRKKAADLKRLLQLLMPGFYAGGLKLPLVTEVLSLIDHSLVGGRSLIPLQGSADMLYLRRLLEQAMLKVIETGEDYTGRQEKVLAALCEYLSAGPVSGIVSTNYDIAIERELFKPYHTHQEVSRNFDFGVRWRDPDSDGHPQLYHPPARPRRTFYKLHGSVNWLRCECCEHLYINTRGEISELAYDKVTDDNSCDCGHAPLSTVLVAPSFIRDIRDPNLLAIWEHALELLRTADEWVIIGYSLPPEDIGIRSLLIRAGNARGEKERPKITVVQLDETAYSAYKLFFPECDYRTGGLEGFLGLTPE